MKNTQTDFTIGCIMTASGQNENATEAEILEAWQYLVDTGIVWRLEGWFGRTAQALIDAGEIKGQADELAITDIEERAARLLLLNWTGLRFYNLDPRRFDDIAQLLAMHRAGKIFKENGDFTEAAYISTAWPSGNHGTAARIISVYRDLELNDPGEIWQDMDDALEAAKRGETA